MTSTTGTIETSDGLTLLTRDWRCEEPTARILLVHGIGEHSGRYEHVGQFFSDRGFAVSGYDHRGHGASAGRRVHVDAFTEFLDDLELILGAIPSDLPRVVYGHSMGALISTGYGISDRPQPDVYVLSAPALEADVPAPLVVAANVMGKYLPKVSLPNSVKGEQLSKDPAVGEAYFADPLVETKATTRFGAEMLAEMKRVRNQIDGLHTPALVIHGADDVLVPPQASAPLAGVDGVDRKLFPGLRHEVHNEPEQVEVLSFVADWVDGQLT